MNTRTRGHYPPDAKQINRFSAPQARRKVLEIKFLDCRDRFILEYDEFGERSLRNLPDRPLNHGRLSAHWDLLGRE